MDKFAFLPKEKLSDLPKTSGVYCFKDKNELIYIGKAVNIRDRVKNHFQQPSYRDDLYISKVSKIGYLKTGSEIEALILEANLIKKYQPKYNVVWRDDKNYFYVAIAQNEQKIPYVYITHQKNDAEAGYIGPFVEGVSLKKTLRFLRRVFPYYTAKKHPKNKCTYCHLDLCPGPDPDLIGYKKNIKKLILILRGKRGAVLKLLRKEMQQLSKENRFEEAAKTRDRMHALAQVMAHTRVINPQQTYKNALVWQKTQRVLEGITGAKTHISRIECYDVSNIQGTKATGSMAVFKDGIPDKDEYRKFKIRIAKKPNDIAMLKETIERRLSHKEWPYPEVMLIDGGIAQLNVAISVKNQKAKARRIKIISIAKRNKELYIEGKRNPILLKSLPREIFNLVLQLDDEAHRFAIAYHKKLRKEELLPKS